MKNLPEKIYLNFGEITKEEFEESSFDEFADITWCQDKVFENDVEYIRKDVVDDMLKTAEDHAYFAGSEAMREKIMAKAIDTEIDAVCGVLNIAIPYHKGNVGDKVKVIVIKDE